MENSAIKWKILRLKFAAIQNECKSPVSAEDRKQRDEKKKRGGGLEVLNHAGRTSKRHKRLEWWPHSCLNHNG